MDNVALLMRIRNDGIGDAHTAGKVGQHLACDVV
jgi:hypothetical protein